MTAQGIFTHEQKVQKLHREHVRCDAIAKSTEKFSETNIAPTIAVTASTFVEKKQKQKQNANPDRRAGDTSIVEIDTDTG